MQDITVRKILHRISASVFPAVSAGWILSEEKFMKKQKVIDFLKLRASYGIVGNDKMENARFLYMAGAWSGYNTVAKGQGSWQFGKDGGTGLLPDAKENTMGNPDVTWEKVAKQNYGIDLKMFDSRLSLTADVFFEKERIYCLPATRCRPLPISICLKSTWVR